MTIGLVGESRLRRRYLVQRPQHHSVNAQLISINLVLLDSKFNVTIQPDFAAGQALSNDYNESGQANTRNQKGGDMFDRQLRYSPGHAGYVSEFTRFIDTFMVQHPEVTESRRRGWNIYWDHKMDLEEWEHARQDEVPVKPYSYE